MGLTAHDRCFEPGFHLPPTPCRMVVTWGGDDARLTRRASGSMPGEALSGDRPAAGHHFDIVLDWCDPTGDDRALAAMIFATRPTDERHDRRHPPADRAGSPGIARWCDGGSGIEGAPDSRPARRRWCRRS
jgi:hypothetical protein